MPYKKQYMREYRQRLYVQAKRRAYEKEYYLTHPVKRNQRLESLKKWQRKKKLEMKIKAINLLGSKCSQCGYQKCLAALEFHHQKEKGEKEYLLTDLIRQLKPWVLIEKEVKKCILLCSNCHKELTYK